MRRPCTSTHRSTVRATHASPLHINPPIHRTGDACVAPAHQPIDPPYGRRMRRPHEIHQSANPRNRSLMLVFDSVFASTCFTITAQYSECEPSLAGNWPDTTTLYGGTEP